MQTKDYNDDYAWWRFIEDNLPNYYSCDEVLTSNIYSRYLDDDCVGEMCPSDLEDIKRKFGGDRAAVVRELIDMDTDLFRRALTAFYEKRFLS